MSYQVRPKQTYKPQRRLRQMLISPHHHENFRVQWDANFDKALTQAVALKEKGFLVEECLDKGTLMESQAKRVAKNLQEAGWEVQLIPVAQWAGENVVFLVYKPPKEGAVATPIAKKPQPKPKKSAPLTPEEFIERYVKNFTYKSGGTIKAPDPSQMQIKGYIMDPQQVTAIVDPNAPSTEPIHEMYRKARSTPTPNPITFMNTPKFRKALQMFKKRFGKQNICFTQQPGKRAVSIDNLLKTLRTLGDGPIQVYDIDGDKPFYFEGKEAYVVAIATVYDPDSTLTVPLSVVEKEASLN